MANRTDIIARQITAYDKIIAADRTISDVELAIFKIAICQLVDAVFSGGGGGGGSTSASTIASGVDASADINSILVRLQSIDTKTISQSDIVAAIQTAADIDSIITLLTSIDTKTGSGGSTTSQTVSDGINQSIDIDTIITRLTSIAANTSSLGGGGESNIVGSYTSSAPTITDAGNTVLAANSSRKHAIIINRSASVCDLFFGAVGVFGVGLPLQPKQSYEINNLALYRGIITCIASTGNTVNLAVSEGI